jgi:hypothetical protein
MARPMAPIVLTHPPSVSGLLDAWERGLAQSPLDRAITLLAAICPDRSREELADASVGRRDAALLTLREWTFGTSVLCLAACPACGDQLELAFETADIRVPPDPAGDQHPTLDVEGHAVVARPPTTRDLARLSADGSIDENRRRLLEQCVLTARHGDEALAVADLPDGVVDAVAAWLGEIDPQADVQLDLRCPSCEHGWQAPFDIASFLWSELGGWAARLLREIHGLALTYGWSERDILALSPARRAIYLAMAGR